MATMLVIKCPTTDEEVPIGILLDVRSIDYLPAENMQMVCPACGAKHDWSKENAYLSVKSPEKLGRRKPHLRR